jgi:ABC-type branched-subunit amino acid transport system substrate-binding protein
MRSKLRIESLAMGLALVVGVVVGLAGCGSASGSGGKGGGSVVVAEVGPFTGPDAVFGTVQIAGCAPAVLLVNEAGGVLGHKFACKTVDTHGDAADAVPAVQQLLATTGNLGGIIGPSSDEATAVVPSIERQHVTMFGNMGLALYDHSTSKYLWRLTPPDDAAGLAMALWAHKQGYTRAAAVFGNDISAQGTVPTLFRAFTTKLGGKIVVNEKLAPGQSSYRSEVESVIAAHPQVIFDELDAQSAATFFSEFAQLNGKPIPAIGADPTLTPQFFDAVKKAIGVSNVIKYITAENPAGNTSGAAWQSFRAALIRSGSQVPGASQYTTEPYSEHNYDAVNIMALAMLKAGSIVPAKYNGSILAVTSPRAGAVVVHTFAAGKAALAAGKQIQYVGAAGPALFDQYQNAPPEFAIERWASNGTNVTLATLSPAEIAAIK